MSRALPSTGYKYIKESRNRWWVQLRQPTRKISRGFDTLEAAVEFRDWVLASNCSTTQDTYQHPEGKRFLLA